MRNFKSDNFAALYKDMLQEVIKNPDSKVAPRGEKTQELYNVVLELTNPLENTFFNSVRAPSEKYLAGELIWYFSGRNDLAFIKKYSKFWSAIACENGTCNSAYGNLLFNEVNEYGFTEWAWALTALKKDKNTRQAIMRFNKPRFSYENNKDFVCTLAAQFIIRNNALHFTVIMRSNDLRFGIQYDVPFFTTLQQVMHKQLLSIYPDLQLGCYTHIVNSIHLYEKDIDEAKNSLESQFYSTRLPTIETLLPVSGEGRPVQAYMDLSYGLIDPAIQDTFYRWVAKAAGIFSDVQMVS
ncbi:MAG: hypothetical protein A2103_03585 [Gammaproteobacteria bacterium GWF2_41_13]|nr:MAG: hypothetical protein A2103_03585 [Gammaproteobacteria bacterium GWF2_41_13]